MVEYRASRRRRRMTSIAQAYRESNEVMSASLAVALLSAGGYWLDLKYGWKPVLTICGLVIGCIVAAGSLRQMLIRLDRQANEKKSKSSTGNLPKSD